MPKEDSDSAQIRQRMRAVKKRVSALLEGYDRCENLLGVILLLPQEEDGLEPYVDELLRAVIVLLHALLEDASRELIREGTCLNQCGKEAIERLPLPRRPARAMAKASGPSEDLRLPRGESATKKSFTLADLRPYSNMQVDDLIQTAFSEYLDHLAFSSVDVIVDEFRRWCEIGLHQLDEYFPYLAAMIERRHQIVHRADLVDVGESQRELAPVDFDELTRWLWAVSGFVLEASFMVLVSDDQELRKRRMGGMLDKLRERFWEEP